MKNGFNISHLIPSNSSSKYKSILFITEAVPVIYTLFIFINDAPITSFTWFAIVNKFGTIYPK